MCLEETGEPKGCKLEIRFQGKSTNFAVDETHGIAFSEERKVEKREVASCEAVSTLILTRVYISESARIGIKELLDLPEEDECVNSVGELFGVKNIFSLFLGSYTISVGFVEEDKDFNFNQPEVIR
jgi:hypothetical protein